MTYPHKPAAFINAIAEEGTKEEAVKYLQVTWNELCHFTDQVRALELEIEELKQINYELTMREDL